MTIPLSTLKSNRALIALYGLVFVLFLPATAFADTPLYQQTDTTGTPYQINSGNTFSPLPAVTFTSINNVNMAASSTAYVQLEINRSSALFDNSPISSFGNNPPRLILENNGATCVYNYFFTQADVNTMFAAWAISSTNYATMTFAMTQESFSSGCNVSIGDTWKFILEGLTQTAPGVYASGVNLPVSSGQSTFPYIYLIASGLPIESNFATHIDSVVPPQMASTTTATPVALGAIGYVSPGDFNNAPGNTYLQWSVTSNSLYTSQCADVGCAANTAGTFYRVPITASTTFSVSTTSPAVPDGIYTLTTSIVQSNSVFTLNGFLSLFGVTSGYTNLVSTTTEFFVGTTTPFDQIVSNATGYGALVASTATSTQAALALCSPLSGSFDIGGCTSVLFFPNANDFQALFNNARNGLLQRMPWGYVTRIVTILGDTSTTTATSLPTFTATFNEASGTTDSLTFNPGDMLNGGAAILAGIKDPNSGENLQQITEPWLQLFIALSVLIIIFHDVMAMGNHKKGQHR